MILIQNALVLTPSAEAKALDVLVDKSTIADAKALGEKLHAHVGHFCAGLA